MGVDSPTSRQSPTHQSVNCIISQDAATSHDFVYHDYRLILKEFGHKLRDTESFDIFSSETHKYVYLYTKNDYPR